MDKSIALPQWLDTLIYDDFKAIYEPRPLDVVYNPNQPFDFVRVYLGTYFPRSFAESYCILGNLLEIPEYRQSLYELDHVNVLDFCCGTGGELLGLISILQSKLPNLKRITIDATDANVEAIRFLYHLIDKTQQTKEISIEIDIHPQCLFVQSELELKDLVNIFDRNYHFILSFKALNEFVQSGTFPNDNVYKKFASIFSTALQKNGVFVLSDVTTKFDKENVYYPNLMNVGINEFVRENNSYKTLIPYSCYNFETSCQGCYMQDTFYVSHSKKRNDVSKVAYRIICHSEFAHGITNSFNKTCICRYNNKSAEKNVPYLK